VNVRGCVEQVQQLEERLAELEEERKELAKFQQIDKQRRSLEFAIYDKELADTRAKLDQVPACNLCTALLLRISQRLPESASWQSIHW
jgi:chromosome segregation ATPase